VKEKKRIAKEAVDKPEQDIMYLHRYE